MFVYKVDKCTPPRVEAETIYGELNLKIHDIKMAAECTQSGEGHTTLSSQLAPGKSSKKFPNGETAQLSYQHG